MKGTALLIAALSCASVNGINRPKSAAGCGDGMVRGVNLGGWFVLEPWITPVFFEEVNDGGDMIVDEYTYAQYLDADTYQQRMVNHWNTFYTEQDFQDLYNSGISHMRMPIAYWYWDVEDGEPFPAPNMDDTDMQSPLFYIKRAIQWMDKIGLQVSLDLHTGPGSQNGYDNSGRRGESHWVDGSYPGNRYNLDRTVSIVDQFSATTRQWIDAGEFSIDTLYGVGILNEPHICGYQSGATLWPACRDDFYPKAHEAVRKYFSGEEAKVVVDVASVGFGEFEGGVNGDPNVDLDAHNYQCFGGYWNEVALSQDGWNTHLQTACAYGDEIAASPIPTWTGEFSLSVTECTKYLSGGYMIEYIPPDNDPSLCEFYNNDFSTYIDEYKSFMKDFFLAQIDAYERGAGWIFWTGKTENNSSPEWDYLFLLQQGIMPADLCSRDTYC